MLILVINPSFFLQFPVFLSIVYFHCRPHSITPFFPVWAVKRFFFIYWRLSPHFGTCSITCFQFDMVPIMLSSLPMFPFSDHSETNSVVLFTLNWFDFLKLIPHFYSHIPHDHCCQCCNFHKGPWSIALAKAATLSIKYRGLLLLTMMQLLALNTVVHYYRTCCNTRRKIPW